MRAEPFQGGTPTSETIRRRRLLLGGLILAAAVIVVAVVRISTGDETEPNGSGSAPPVSQATAAPPEPPPSAAEAPTTTTEAPPPTTTEAPPTTTEAPPPPTTTEAPPPTTEAPPPPTTTEAPPPPTTTTTTEPPPPPPVALLSTAGIPVTVLEVLEEGYLVRTPCGGAVEIPGGERIEPVRVVLDPGHGGAGESGAVGPNGLTERDLNLTLSEATLAELEARGISAATTRSADYMVSLRVRAELADALEAEALISIHHNAPTWEPTETPGTEIYVQSESADAMRPASARLGGLLYEEITAALGRFEDVQWSGLPDAGVKRVLLPDGTDTYALVRYPETPAVLVEYGYLSNPAEAALFATEDYIAAAAAATADAVEAFLGTDRPGSGFIDETRTYDPGGYNLECIDTPLEPPPPEVTNGGESDGTGTEATDGAAGDNGSGSDGSSGSDDGRNS